MSAGNSVDLSDEPDKSDMLKDPKMICCKLFDDTVTAYLCSIRRRELHDRGVFSCIGCKER